MEDLGEREICHNILVGSGIIEKCQLILLKSKHVFGIIQSHDFLDHGHSCSLGQFLIQYQQKHLVFLSHKGRDVWDAVNRGGTSRRLQIVARDKVLHRWLVRGNVIGLFSFTQIFPLYAPTAPPQNDPASTSKKTNFSPLTEANEAGVN